MGVFASDVFDHPALTVEDRARLIMLMQREADKNGAVLVHSSIREQLGGFNERIRGHWVHAVSAEVREAA